MKRVHTRNRELYRVNQSSECVLISGCVCVCESMRACCVRAPAESPQVSIHMAHECERLQNKNTCVRVCTATTMQSTKAAAAVANIAVVSQQTLGGLGFGVQTRRLCTP